MAKKTDYRTIEAGSYLDNFQQEFGYLFPEKVIPYQNRFSAIFEKSIFYRFTAAFFISLIAITIKYIVMGPFDVPYLLPMLGVTIAALYGGFSGGLIATAITSVLINFLFIPPQFSLKLDGHLLIENLVYLTQGTLVTYLIAKERNTRKKTYDQAEQFHVTLSSIGDGVIVVNSKGYINFMNKIAEELTGWSRDEAAGEKIEKVFKIVMEKTGKKASSPVRMVIKKNRIATLANHTILIRKNGSVLPIDDSAAPIRDVKGNLTGVVLIFRDITQRKQLEQRKDDFVSMTSHELKTPVTSMKLYIELLQKKLRKRGDIEYVPILDKVDNQVSKLAILVNDFLDLSRIQSGKLHYRKKPVHITRLVSDTIKDMEQLHHKAKFILEAEINRKLYIDEDRIKQVLINLMTNAVKYSKKDDSRVIVRIEKVDGHALVKIKDFGVGVPKDQHAKIFNRFYQADTPKSRTYPGLGLGLYISSQIVKGHHGKLWVESEIGKGSTFQFSIPLKKYERRKVD